MRNLRKRLDEPIIADRSVDLMAAAFWFCIAGWGISSTIAGIPTISAATTPLYELLWGATIGVTASVAFAAAASMFLNSTSVQARIKKKTTEFTAVCILAGFMSVYPILLFTAALGGDTNRIALTFVGLSFLAVPTWRARHLYRRIAKLREVVATTPTGVR